MAHSNNGIAMPHASYLAYFRQWAPTQKNTHRTAEKFEPAILSKWTSPYLRSGKLADEEARFQLDTDAEMLHPECKNSGYSATSKYKRNRHGLYDIWSILCVVSFTCSVLLFGLDLVFGRYGMGTGIAECFVQTSAISSTSTNEMQFCLVTPNREAPGPQTWRLLSTESRNDCTTETVTLLAGPTAQWNMHVGDRVSIADEWAQLDLIQRSPPFHSNDEKKSRHIGEWPCIGGHTDAPGWRNTS